jgi:hypothetical protein
MSPVHNDPPPPPLPPEVDRLFRIYKEQSLLAQELERNMARIALARAYLARPGCNTLLGAARLKQLRAARSGLLARSRACRIEALELQSFPHTQLDLSV